MVVSYQARIRPRKVRSVPGGSGVGCGPGTRGAGSRLPWALCELSESDSDLTACTSRGAGWGACRERWQPRSRTKNTGQDVVKGKFIKTTGVRAGRGRRSRVSPEQGVFCFMGKSGGPTLRG